MYNVYNAFNRTNKFFWPLFAYISYNFYGAVICIKAVYSKKSQCKAPRSKIFKFKNFDHF